MPATQEPDTPADNRSQPPYTAVTRHRFAEEDLRHVLTAICLDYSVIDHVIVDSGIRKLK